MRRVSHVQQGGVCLLVCADLTEVPGGLWPFCPYLVLWHQWVPGFPSPLSPPGHKRQLPSGKGLKRSWLQLL